MGLSYKRRLGGNIHQSCGQWNRNVRGKYLLTAVCLFTVSGDRIPMSLQERMSKSANEFHREGGVILYLPQESVKGTRCGLRII